MTRIPLQHWQLIDTAPDEGAPNRLPRTGWSPVTAPGDTYLALITAGRLAHPFNGRHEADAHWVRDREWWFRTSFTAPTPAPGETAELVLEGLDTFATIYLDGVEIARTDNMFRRYAFDLGGRLMPGEHAIIIRFDPPSRVISKTDLPVWSAFTDRVSKSNRNLMRKAQFGWGWDWGPDLPTVGLWRPAFVEIRPRARLADIRFATRTLQDTTAVCELTIETRDATPTATLYAELRTPDGTTAATHTAPASEPLSIPWHIAEAELWWTADLGAQPLYELGITLSDGGRVLDRDTRRVGLRTIALDTSDDPAEPGTSFFRFVLNGVPMFAKGACWVPATSFVGAPDEQAYRRLIRQTAAANMNMLRIWGGGIYEPDVFYDLCDEMGVLVWQDFMFACAQYPEDEAFQRSVAAELEDQVRRLRHHPSLALWCGNNECQAMHRINNDRSGETGALSGLALYDRLMPALLAKLDPATPYWPSSPWGGPNPNSMRAGDVHNWTVWHGIPLIPDDEMVGGFQSSPEGITFTRYAEDKARFVSEFGIQAAPALATLKRWMGAADLTPQSEGFHQRIKDEARKAEALMSLHTGAPQTLQDYVDFTQWIQAEGLKFGIEHFRRRRPHCSGALLWQLNDCWPSVSWSLIDYDGTAKAGYHAVRRAFGPILASFRTCDDGQIELWITNDRLTPVDTRFTLSLERLTGETVHREARSVQLPASGHVIAWRGTGPSDAGEVLRVTSGDFETNRLFAASIGQLELPEVPPTVDITRLSLNKLKVTFAARAYLAFAHLVSDRADLDFDDNYFDLAAGESRAITVTATGPIADHDVIARWWRPRR
ncbi:hypothetical protein sos41_40070 [Alphaproteobacteria bacterium SO-S41]|nr:hypothetical protein sos41_40070 [Alphaproteobacteria bacterium SO-S41]